MTELEKFFRLTVEVLCDQVPNREMPVYIVGETADNEGSVFPTACGQVGYYPILIGGGDDTAGYPGGEVWAQRVTKLYDVPGRVYLVPMAGPPNTLTEMQALVPYLVKQGWREVVITAAPFHQVRAFLTLLGVLQKPGAKQSIRVYNRVGVPLPWGEKALHSQGALKATRRELIGAEFERIERYTAKGDLATVDQALEYLKHRDAYA